jgi:predicted DNA-binding transcriptional regulator AlpA
MSGRGRRSDAELAMIRERIESLMLAGYRSPAIHRALSGSEAPKPIDISERSVRSHKRAIERGWQERASREQLEAEHAKAIAMAEETVRTAFARSSLNARDNVGVGYLNTAVRGQELLARLRGLNAPLRTEIAGPGGGPVAVAPIAALTHEPATPEEELRRLGLRRVELEAQIGFRLEEAGEGEEL